MNGDSAQLELATGDARGAPMPNGGGAGRLDDASLAYLNEALRQAREADDRRPPFEIIRGSLPGLGVVAIPQEARTVDVRAAERDWMGRLQGSGRSPSTLAAYRTALEDLRQWLPNDGAPHQAAFSEETIVAYLDHYRRRAQPAPATYYRRFTLLRRFFRWFSSRAGIPDPFLDLDPPPKPAPVADWLTPEEFAALLAGASTPRRVLPGLVERDRLVLLTLVVTGLRRSELTALNWGDVELKSPRPSLLVRNGKGGKPRRQPIPEALARELAQQQGEKASPDAPVFRGLRGARLQPTILAGIIRRAAERAGLEKRVTAHTLRHTAATWLRHATGDTRLVAEYLGHADLSTVHRYAHVASEELDDAAAKIAETAGLTST